MSSIDVLVSCENVELKQNVKKEIIQKEENMKKNVENDTSSEDVEEYPTKQKKKFKYTYDKEILLELRSAPASLAKPAFLSDEFFKDGCWDPELWHKSNTSRSASPAVDGKSVVVDGKKVELIDDSSIKLAPHSRSFKQGCHVQANTSKHQIEEKVHLPNPPRSSYEKKNRLTGRAAGLRKSMETEYRDQEGSFYDKRTERFNSKDSRNDRFFDPRNRYNENEKHDFVRKDQPLEKPVKNLTKERHDSYNKNKHEKEHVTKKPQHQHENDHHQHQRNDKLPEWMTDGPTSQLDIMEFTGFQDIEDEKKAFAKQKKKVRISPDVTVQQMKYDDEKKTQRRRATPPPPKKKVLKEEKEGKVASKPTKKAKQGSENEAKQPTNNKQFDLNQFFNGVDYYPPQMFQEDVAKGDGVKSRFTQWFQSQISRSSSRSSVISNVSRPGSAGLIPDEVFTGPQSKSPSAQQPAAYFTPIQPAPALVVAAANAHAIQTSNILNIIQKQNQQTAAKEEVPKNEIKGRLTVEDLEEKKPMVAAADNQELINHNAFAMFVQSMKEAGQLPEKPSPVVTGLPEHLLPKPPNRSSPIFQKLKQSLSRSPSPQEYMKAVSTIASIVANNPSIQNESSIITSSDDFFNQSKLRTNSTNNTPQGSNIRGNNTMNSTFQPIDQTYYTPGRIQDPFNRPEHQRTPMSMSDLTAAHNSTVNTSVDNEQKRIPKGFLPTSVIKKMHNEKCESPIPFSQHGPDVSMVHIKSSDSSYPDLLTETMRATKVPLPSSTSSNPADTSLEMLSNDFENHMNVTPNRHYTDALPFHSAPVTPRQPMFPVTSMNLQLSVSAPGTPDRRLHGDPPPIHRLTNHNSANELSMRGSAFSSPKSNDVSRLLAPSAFQATSKPNKSVVGVIGSGKPHGEFDTKLTRSDASFLPHTLADSRLTPGSSIVRGNKNTTNPNLAPGHPLKPSMHSTPMPQSQPSQQQQLLQAQRMAQIQQAQLLQQQKLKQIAHDANQRLMQQQQHKPATSVGTPVGVKPLLPDPDPLLAHQATQQQQQQQQSQQHGFNQLPRPDQQHQQMYQQQQRQQIQAFQQQQLLQQQQQKQAAAARSQLNNMNNNFRTPVRPPFQGGPTTQQQQRNMPPLPLPMQQAAAGLHALNNMNRPQQQGGLPNFAAQALQQQLLNQAARARFIAQAQLLQQQPHVMQAAFMAQAALARGQAQAQAAMMLNQMGLRSPNPVNNHINKSIPTPMLPNQNHMAQNNFQQGRRLSPENDVLSKWFDKDVLQHIPQKPDSNVPPSGRIMSVEELENTR